MASSPAEIRTLLAASLLARAASLTMEMFCVTSSVPLDASSTLRAISRVAAVCSSTAAAMVADISWLRLIVCEICWIVSAGAIIPH